MSDRISFRTTYMDDALLDLEGVIEHAVMALNGLDGSGHPPVDFDTIVGTGLSGTVVIPALALRMNKNFLIIRKSGDDSHHGDNKPVGMLGKRWIFLDDFVAGGSTRERVLEKVLDAVQYTSHVTTYVGDYLYRNGGQFRPAVEQEMRHAVSDESDTREPTTLDDLMVEAVKREGRYDTFVERYTTRPSVNVDYTAIEERVAKAQEELRTYTASVDTIFGLSKTEMFRKLYGGAMSSPIVFGSYTGRMTSPPAKSRLSELLDAVDFYETPGTNPAPACDFKINRTPTQPEGE